MSIQSNINKLLGIANIAARTSPSLKSDSKQLEKDLSNVESQVHSLGKYDVEAKKFRGTKTDFARIKALGLDKQYTDLLKRGSSMGIRDPQEAADLILGMEKKQQPTKAALIKQKATDIEINQLAKEKALARMQGKGVMKILQNNEFEQARRAIGDDMSFTKYPPHIQEAILKQYVKGGYNKDGK